MQALGIFISYNKQENNKKNVVNKIDNLNIKLDLWRGCNLSLFGKCLIVKSLGISQIVYSASMLDIRLDDASRIKKSIFSIFGIRNRIKSKEMLCAKTILMGDCGPLIQIFYSNLCD